MKRYIRNIIAAFTIVFLSIGFTIARELTAREIMQKNDEQRTSKDEQSELTMELINRKGKKRVRKVRQITKTKQDGNEKSLIRFLAPADVRGTGLLTVEQSDRDDDQWLYLPALKKVRRISASDQSDNFMGTDFAFEDLRSEELDKYHYTLLGKEIVDSNECYVIEAAPSDPQEKKDSGYSKRILWIRADNFVTVRIKFFDKKEELLKIFKSSDIREIGNSAKWRAHRIEMENLKTGHKTVLYFNNYIINKGVEDRYFTQRYLERGR
ncbi:MAG: outer membrane lipoprotein-sorting protein [Calditrichaeota bacterium]|nr:outer membrane lipoprotein-sorting protein [Calditrichota bacterium]